MKEITYKQAIIEALDEEMERDEDVVLLGEDVGFYGGAFGATTGLFDKYGEERVKDTPISEAAIAGAATGAALNGMRPVAEFMFIDFTTIASDQIINQAAKIRYMFGGKAKVPVVFRTQGGGGKGTAAQHSQSLEALYNHIPGLKVVMPSTPYDAKGLLKSAIRDDNPVFFVEHKMIYNTKGEVPEEEYTVPIGKADVKREGEDVTIIATSRTLLRALDAADKLAKEGIEAEVIDPRTLSPLDEDTIIKSVKKTGKVVLGHEGYKTNGFASEVSAAITESEAFDFLKTPIQRICGADVPIPYSGVLEREILPQVDDLYQAAKKAAEMRV